MANAYRALFAAPGSAAFCSAGLLAQLPTPMIGIGIIAMLSAQRGDYAVAGAVSATFTLVMALVSPQVSRIVDRRGQRRVLLPVTAVSVVSLGVLCLCAQVGAPTWTLFLFAGLAGCMPSMAAMVRARWSEIYRDSPLLHTAYSLESVVDEITFVIGPALSVALSTAVFPAAGPLAAAVLLAVGVVLFVSRRDTEPPVRSAAEVAGASVIRRRPVQLLVLVMITVGAIVGTIDVVAVAFAEDRGNVAAAGIVVSLYAVSSGVTGLLFGMVKTSMKQPRLLLLGTIGTALTLLPLLVVSDIPTLAVVMFASGVFFAPVMIVVMGLVERLVPAARLTEGMTWSITGMSIGVAAGAAVAGAAVDALGPSGGFAVAIGSGVLGVLLAAIAYRPLTAATDRVPALTAQG